MKNICIILFALFAFCAPSFARDVVQMPDRVYSGKITAYSDGLIQIRQKGVEYSVIRSMDKDYFGDYVSYVEHPFERLPVEVRCRLSFVDLHTVIIETERGRMKIPRYRVKAVILYAS